nr:CASP-like protein 4A1 [Lolium perenne]
MLPPPSFRLPTPLTATNQLLPAPPTTSVHNVGSRRRASNPIDRCKRVGNHVAPRPMPCRPSDTELRSTPPASAETPPPSAPTTSPGPSPRRPGSAASCDRRIPASLCEKGPTPP